MRFTRFIALNKLHNWTLNSPTLISIHSPVFQSDYQHHRLHEPPDLKIPLSLPRCNLHPALVLLGLRNDVHTNSSMFECAYADVVGLSYLQYPLISLPFYFFPFRIKSFLRLRWCHLLFLRVGCLWYPRLNSDCFWLMLNRRRKLLRF